MNLHLTLSTDINECSQPNTHSCHAKATCQNEAGSYSCNCRDGYRGNGKTTCNGKLKLLEYYTFSYIYKQKVRANK